MLFHLSEYLLTVTDECAPAIMITDHHSYFDAEDDCSNSYYSQFHVENRCFVDAGSQIEGQAVILFMSFQCCSKYCYLWFLRVPL